MLYLEAENNIDELEVIKANYEVFKDNYLNKFSPPKTKNIFFTSYWLSIIYALKL